MKVFVLAILLVAVCCLKGAVVKRDEGEAKTQVEAHSQQQRGGGDDETGKLVQEIVHELLEIFMEYDNNTRIAIEIKKQVEELEQGVKDLAKTAKDTLSKSFSFLAYVVSAVQDRAAPQASEVPPQETN